MEKCPKSFPLSQIPNVPIYSPLACKTKGYRSVQYFNTVQSQIMCPTSYPYVPIYDTQWYKAYILWAFHSAGYCKSCYLPYLIPYSGQVNFRVNFVFSGLVHLLCEVELDKVLLCVGVLKGETVLVMFVFQWVRLILFCYLGNLFL